MNETRFSFEKKVFLFFILLSALLWTLGSTFFYQEPHQDVIEGIAWGNQWQLGYNKMPPLTAWLCAGITDLFRGDIGFPVYLLAQLCVLVSYVFVWKMARVVASERVALCSVLLLAGVIYYSINSPDITPDTLSTPLWALTTYYTYRAFSRGRLKYWFILGFLAALAVYAKYSVPLLFFPLLLATLVHPVGRNQYKTIGPFLGLGFMIILLLPHVLWLIKAGFPTFKYVTHSAMSGPDNPYAVMPLQSIIGRRLASFSDVLMNQGAILLPVFISFLLLYKIFMPMPYKVSDSSVESVPATSPLQPSSPEALFAYWIISAAAWGPLVLTLVVAFLTGDHIIPRWSTPYYSFMGLWLLLTFKPFITMQKLKQVILASFFILFALFIGRWLYVSFYLPYYGKIRYYQIDTAKVTDKTLALWNARESTPLKYIAGDHYLSAYISVYGKLIPFMGASIGQSPWINLKDLRCRGAMFAYPDSLVPRETMKEFPLEFLEKHRFPYRYHGKYENMGMDVNFYLLAPDPKACV